MSFYYLSKKAALVLARVVYFYGVFTRWCIFHAEIKICEFVSTFLVCGTFEASRFGSDLFVRVRIWVDMIGLKKIQMYVSFYLPVVLRSWICRLFQAQCKLNDEQVVDYIMVL